MKPLIGITTPRKGYNIQNLAIRLCLKLSGARTVNLYHGKECSIPTISGLVLSGGTDLHPRLYNREVIKKNYQYNTLRDEYELNWLKKAKQLKLPIFCICRGAQLLNVFEGGTLHFNVAHAYENANYPTSLLAKIFFRKSIFVRKQSKLSEVLKKNETEVNSMHSQSIDELGDALQVSAVEKNGVIQAVEAESRESFIMGFQFHPEFLYHKREIRNLFREFVDAAMDFRRSQ